jgi:hypothetical protein
VAFEAINLGSIPSLAAKLNRLGGFNFAAGNRQTALPVSWNRTAELCFVSKQNK